MRNLASMMIFALLFVVSGLAYASPKMEFDNTTFDFGEVYQGAKVRHVFQFVNTGEDLLKIDRVRSSCGCTAVLVSEKNLPPGSKGEIQANFDSARFRGAVKKTIYLYSNDPEHPVLQLHVKGKVVEVVTIDPPQVNFGRVSPDQSLAAKVTLRNQGKGPIKLGKPSTTATELQAEMPEIAILNGEEVTLQLLLSPKPGKNRFSGYVIVPAVGVPKDQLRIPVYATIEK
jgi:hypothetical protein